MLELLWVCWVFIITMERKAPAVVQKQHAVHIPFCFWMWNQYVSSGRCFLFRERGVEDQMQLSWEEQIIFCGSGRRVTYLEFWRCGWLGLPGKEESFSGKNRFFHELCPSVPNEEDLLRAFSESEHFFCRLGFSEAFWGGGKHSQCCQDRSLLYQRSAGTR